MTQTCSRFIPACAGNTKRLERTTKASAVHPRVRGEHVTRAPDRFRFGGSSPRARGTRPRPGNDGPAKRFIPACAGNTSISTASHTRTTVHPRVRGEHVLRGAFDTVPNGSSPRARGTPIQDRSSAAPRRFIPACAGNTSPIEDQYSIDPVHPRVRGEHLTRNEAQAHFRGSSPRARGTQFVPHPFRERCRFIPACAGNTVSGFDARLFGPVHPRVRGEHHSRAQRNRSEYGSSPRARGTQRSGGRWLAVLRFIPACAGNTNEGKRK